MIKSGRKLPTPFDAPFWMAAPEPTNGKAAETCEPPTTMMDAPLPGRGMRASKRGRSRGHRTLGRMDGWLPGAGKQFSPDTELVEADESASRAEVPKAGGVNKGRQESAGQGEFSAARSLLTACRWAIMDHVVATDGLLTATCAINTLRNPTGPVGKLTLMAPQGKTPYDYAIEVGNVCFTLAGRVTGGTAWTLSVEKRERQVMVALVATHKTLLLATVSKFPPVETMFPDSPFEDLVWRVTTRVNNKQWSVWQLLPGLLFWSLQLSGSGRAAQEFAEAVQSLPFETLPTEKSMKLDQLWLEKSGGGGGSVATASAPGHVVFPSAVVPASTFMGGAFVGTAPGTVPPPPLPSYAGPEPTAAPVESSSSNSGAEHVRPMQDPRAFVFHTMWDAMRAFCAWTILHPTFPPMAMLTHELDLGCLGILHAQAREYMRLASAGTHPLDAYVISSYSCPEMRRGLWTLFLLPFCADTGAGGSHPLFPTVPHLPPTAPQ